HHLDSLSFPTRRSSDLTDAVARFYKKGAAKRFNGRIPILVRTDNSRDVEMIPSDLSDFNVYGGLYRYVNLCYVPTLSTRHLFAEDRKSTRLNSSHVKSS